jgi:hypothetical protein
MHEQKARVFTIQSIHFYQLRTNFSLSAWRRKSYTLSLFGVTLYFQRITSCVVVL